VRGFFDDGRLGSSMSPPVEAVLFDLDDTLCVYEQTADEVLAAAFDAVGVEPFFDGDEYVARFDEFLDAGEEIAEIRRASFAAFAEEAGYDPALGRDIATAYAERRDPRGVAFTPGAREALDAVADDYRVGMVTNGDPTLQGPKLDSLGIGHRFETVVHGGVDAPYKPDPEPFHLALDELDVAPDRAVHVGNSLESDVRGALAAGVRAAWIADSREPDPQPDYVFETVAGVADEPWR
jgi:FMN phosphatase YigB (HAD superfamily)